MSLCDESVKFIVGKIKKSGGGVLCARVSAHTKKKKYI